ncbi:exosortase family protein XrtF [Flavobacterium sp. HSC-32F16]|uniref:exosortase family protein XrtF n=1 Tax=Flavobacterium sp. HSC-32F16 TaxID=2910964 RepID=UPI0020A3CBEB|nr:exosortase family protein XrtF [Flavobacterium sp. HSC-32F16]MCP2026839.1 exosortase family protein XrtF [Flavobacterium sp. HSC-32F16]
MRKYLIQFKPFLIFIGTFFAAYIALTVVYKFYLNSLKADEVDAVTSWVGHNVEQLLSAFNYDIKVQQGFASPWLEVWFNTKYQIRIVEGCNAVSVIILFVSFVLAFSGRLKVTLLYILFGIIFIYILNVVRIALLTVLLFHFPDQSHLLHGVLFPLAIYGSVFLLWVIWVNKFSKYAK